MLVLLYLTIEFFTDVKYYTYKIIMTTSLVSFYIFINYLQYHIVSIVVVIMTLDHDSLVHFDFNKLYFITHISVPLYIYIFIYIYIYTTYIYIYIYLYIYKY